MSFRDKIAIVGAGCTTFGENFALSYNDLVYDAAFEAFAEAGVGPQDIEAAWLGTAFPDAGPWKGRSGMDLAESLGLFDIPITRVSNYCATGGDALRNACYALLSGEYRVVLALGVEKLRDRRTTDSLVRMMAEDGHPYYQKGFTPAGTFAIYATRYMDAYGATRDHLATISVKNHKHSTLNPKAQYNREVSFEEARAAPMVAYPLNLFDCCPTTDGAAAVVLARREDAPTFTTDSVLIRGQGFAVSTGWDLPFYDPGYSFLGFRASATAGSQAYEDAGIRHPVEEIDLAEVHDCFSIVELLAYEDLGFCPRGEGVRFLLDGHPYREGRLPVNVSGGLLSCGHPVGATGLRMIYELTRQIQGRAGERQVRDAQIGVAHNIGGPGAVSCVTVLAAP